MRVGETSVKARYVQFSVTTQTGDRGERVRLEQACSASSNLVAKRVDARAETVRRETATTQSEVSTGSQEGECDDGL